MNLKRFFKNMTVMALLLSIFSCQDYLDVNKDPNAITEDQGPMEQIFTSAVVSLGFFSGSDLNRYSSLIAQQYSAGSRGTTVQTWEYERYNITGSDANNAWNLMYSTVLSDLEKTIEKANAAKAPAYAGCSKILKAYSYQLLVDAWGNIPYSESLKFLDNTTPKFDDGATVYPAIIALIDEGIANINDPANVIAGARVPIAVTSTPFPAAAAWTTTRARWERLANTLKMRMWLHYSKVDKAKAVTEIGKLVSANVMTANTDNFQMAFYNVAGQYNPIHQFEISRTNYLFGNATLVDMMNTKTDPRRARYFTSFPLFSGKYLGAKGGGTTENTKYSRFFIYLRGDTLATTTPLADGSLNPTGANSYGYTGAAPIRMLTYSEYNFIRAEAAVLGVAGITADSFYRQGIRASMSQSGVASAAAEAYIAANPFPTTGSDADKIKAIIEEKFVSNYGIIMESWTDWRRTGVPTLTAPTNAVGAIPRSLFYPQSEIDLNPNAPKQKGNLDERVFWDK